MTQAHLVVNVEDVVWSSFRKQMKSLGATPTIRDTRKTPLHIPAGHGRWVLSVGIVSGRGLRHE